MKDILSLELEKIGVITGTHGYKGNLLILLEINFKKIIETELFFIEIDKIKVPFFLSKNQKLKHHKNKFALTKFDYIDDENQAKNLVGCNVFIEEDNTEQDEHDIKDKLAGYKVFDKNNFIGKVDSYLKIPSNTILSIKTDTGNEILIPLNEHFIVKINETNKELYLNLPEGLSDLNF